MRVKLKLNTETLRVLSDSDAQRVVGGTTTCPQTGTYHTHCFTCTSCPGDYTMQCPSRFCY